jgi:hypothetical protein
MDLSIFPNEIGTAVGVAIALSASSASTWQIIKTIYAAIVKSDMPSIVSIISPTVLNVVLVGYAMNTLGYEASTIVIAVMIAVFAPNAIYNGVDTAKSVKTVLNVVAEQKVEEKKTLDAVKDIVEDNVPLRDHEPE